MKVYGRRKRKQPGWLSDSSDEGDGSGSSLGSVPPQLSPRRRAHGVDLRSSPNKTKHALEVDVLRGSPKRLARVIKGMGSIENIGAASQRLSLATSKTAGQRAPGEAVRSQRRLGSKEPTKQHPTQSMAQAAINPVGIKEPHGPWDLFDDLAGTGDKLDVISWIDAKLAAVASGTGSDTGSDREQNPGRDYTAEKAPDSPRNIRVPLVPPSVPPSAQNKASRIARAASTYSSVRSFLADTDEAEAVTIDASPSPPRLGVQSLRTLGRSHREAEEAQYLIESLQLEPSSAGGDPDITNKKRALSPHRAEILYSKLPSRDLVRLRHAIGDDVLADLSGAVCLAYLRCGASFEQVRSTFASCSRRHQLEILIVCSGSSNLWDNVRRDGCFASFKSLLEDEWCPHQVLVLELLVIVSTNMKGDDECIALIVGQQSKVETMVSLQLQRDDDQSRTLALLGLGYLLNLVEFGVTDIALAPIWSVIPRTPSIEAEIHIGGYFALIAGSLPCNVPTGWIRQALASFERVVANVGGLQAKISRVVQQLEDLKAHFRENGTFDFDKPGATYDLTEAIMKHSYGVSLTLDRAKLCPRVPNRLSYLQWCQACVAERKALCKSGLRAVDIGTGSSAIYPILGVAIDPGVRFTATELDQSSLDHANTQIIANGLTEQIEFVKVDIEDVIINDKVVGGISSGDTVLFTLCNPPFYCSMEDMSARGALKPARRNQLVASDLELVHHDGGEVGFAEKYIEQSLALQHASFEDCFFTCQLGSFGSFKRVSKLLQSLKAKGRLKSYVGHELSSGKVGTTKRWVLGWSRSSFRYPASRAAIATQPLTSRFDTLVKFEYAKGDTR
ncbi:hypothetical protein ABC855_g382 [[Candida] zeylanoides]